VGERGEGWKEYEKTVATGSQVLIAHGILQTKGKSSVN